MGDIDDKVKVGDKVRCVSTNNTRWPDNACLLDIGCVYTVHSIDTYHRSDGYVLISLEEINAVETRKPNFYSTDFELADKHDDPNTAWDRAFKGI